jgi:hypothetical protein
LKTGFAFYNAYLIVPPFGPFALATAALAVIAIGLLVAAVAGRQMSDTPVARRAVHGA